jgi:hypothetical protein
VVGKTRCKIARRMAQWASSRDDEQQLGAGGSANTQINHSGPSKNDEIPRHPLLDCGQGKNLSDDGGVSFDVAVGVVGIDVASEKGEHPCSFGTTQTITPLSHVSSSCSHVAKSNEPRSSRKT